MLQRKYKDDSIVLHGAPPMVQRHNDDEIALHGIPMTDEAFERMISVESPYRYEWKQELFIAGQTIKLEQLDLEFSLAAVYEGVL